MSLDDSIKVLLQTLCTVEQIQELLRKHKGQKDVRITAETKEDLIDRNVRTAIETGAIKLTEVFDLIRASEENGGQHIFYFVPRTKPVADVADSGLSVADKLFSRTQAASFPRADNPPGEFIWADFRQLSPDTRPRDWLAKVYGHEVYDRFLREEIQNDELHRVYRRESLRLVLLARWNTSRSPREPNLLELRVPRSESRKRLDSWLRRLWTMLAPAFSPQDFVPWDLTQARRKMIERSSANASLYSFRATRVIDAFHTIASFEPHGHELPLLRDQIAADAIRDFMANRKSRCTYLSTVWLKQERALPNTDLVTLIGGREVNEIVVMPKCKAEEVDYVTEQLRSFGK